MAPKCNLKKQKLEQQLCNTTTPTNTPQSTTLSYINSFKLKSLRSVKTTLQPDPITFQSELVRENLSIEVRLVKDNKLVYILVLYTRWKYEDNKEKVLEGESLQVCKQTRYRELELIIFGFPLYDIQVEAISTLFYK